MVADKEFVQLVKKGCGILCGDWAGVGWQEFDFLKIMHYQKAIGFKGTQSGNLDDRTAILNNPNELSQPLTFPQG